MSELKARSDSEKANFQPPQVGILGGTFDPIHFGHLLSASEIQAEFNLQKVLFIPSGVPPHKTHQHITKAEDRLKMVQLAVADNPYFEVLELEINKQSVSYTIDTMKQLKSQYPHETEFFFIIGIDAFQELNTWKDPQLILQLCHFVITSRPGYRLEQILNLFPFNDYRKSTPLELKETTLKRTKSIDFANQHYVSQITALDISASDIRNRVKQGLNIRYLVPEQVRLFILSQKLYQNLENFSERRV